MGAAIIFPKHWMRKIRTLNRTPLFMAITVPKICTFLILDLCHPESSSVKWLGMAYLLFGFWVFRAFSWIHLLYKCILYALIILQIHFLRTELVASSWKGKEVTGSLLCCSVFFFRVLMEVLYCFSVFCLYSLVLTWTTVIWRVWHLLSFLP